jgi:hypothetical protein
MQMRNKIPVSLLIAACAGLIVPRFAFPIGRIGNLTIGDPIQGYLAQVPQDFGQIVITDQDSAVLQSDYIFDPEFGLTVDIQAKPFNQTYPALVTDNEASTLAYFQSITGMSYTVVTANNCGLSLIGESATTWVGISTWGNGNGYVLVAPKVDSAQQGILSLLQNTEIEISCWR